MFCKFQKMSIRSIGGTYLEIGSGEVKDSQGLSWLLSANRSSLRRSGDKLYEVLKASNSVNIPTLNPGQYHPPARADL
jgi:hypothetical protein